MGKPTIRAVLAAAGIALAGAVPATLLYLHTLAYGFDYDDYHFVRPFSLADVTATFHGPWDATGIELPYYRPLTIVMFAARFAWFGFNSEAYHLLSVVAFAVAAVLAGWGAWGLTGRRAAGAFTAVAFAVHPAMPYSLVAWVTNQMHLLEALVVLAALGWWNTVRSRSLGWWAPLWILGAAALLTKEDGVMLLPVLIILHWLRRRTSERTLQPVPMAFTLGSLVLIGLLLWVRNEALAHTTSRALPHFSQAFENYLSGLDKVFRLVPPDRPWQLAACWFASLLPLAGIVAAWRTSPGIRYGLGAGFVIAAGFNLPFVFVTKGEQLHIVATGAAIVIGAAAVSLLDALRPRALKVAAVVVFGVGTAIFAAVSRDISSDFRPFGPIVMSHDKIVSTWAAVPPEIHEYLARKRHPGAEASVDPNPAVAVDKITFGVHPEETSPAGLRYHWMSSARAHIFVNRNTRALTIPLRHEIGAFREPAEAIISVDDRVMDRIALTDGEWRFSRLTLSRATLSRLGSMHHVTVSIDHPWVPSTVIPGSGDSRQLGLQLGPPEVR